MLKCEIPKAVLCQADSHPPAARKLHYWPDKCHLWKEANQRTPTNTNWSTLSSLPVHRESIFIWWAICEAKTSRDHQRCIYVDPIETPGVTQALQAKDWRALRQYLANLTILNHIPILSVPYPQNSLRISPQRIFRTWRIVWRSLQSFPNLQ